MKSQTNYFKKITRFKLIGFALIFPLLAACGPAINSNSNQESSLPNPHNTSSNNANSETPETNTTENYSPTSSELPSAYTSKITNPIQNPNQLGVWTNNNKSPYYTGVIKNEQYHFLNDYSFQIVIKRMEKKSEAEQLQPLLETGTGWVLDYLKPTDNSYPLTWFIATNLHVVKAMTFPNNPYPEVAVPSNAAHKDGEKFSLFYSILSDDKISTTLQDEVIITNPELFFTATNFLGPYLNLAAKDPFNEINWSKLTNYFKDFAVLKINFANENIAKKATRDFASKYANSPTVFASQDLMSKTGDELTNFSDAYVLGYPWSSRQLTINKHQSDNDWTKGSTLSVRDQNEIKNQYHQTLPGMVDATNIYNLQLYYNNQRYERFGLTYAFNDNYLQPGASGSLVVNQQKEVLGIQHSSDPVTQIGYADPLIVQEFSVNHKLYFPGYNLIHGGIKNQTKSFYDSLKMHNFLNQSWLFSKDINKAV